MAEVEPASLPGEEFDALDPLDPLDPPEPLVALAPVLAPVVVPVPDVVGVPVGPLVPVPPEVVAEELIVDGSVEEAGPQPTASTTTIPRRKKDCSVMAPDAPKTTQYTRHPKHGGVYSIKRTTGIAVSEPRQIGSSCRLTGKFQRVQFFSPNLLS